MSNFTTAKALPEIRAYAKNLGMTFKRQNATINGQAAYMLTKRGSGEVLLKNFTLWIAYNAMLGGCFDKVARDASLV